MKFFIPYVRSAREAERVLAATAKLVGEEAPPRGHRIRRLTIEQSRKRFEIVVGRPMPAPYQESERVVACILGDDNVQLCFSLDGVSDGDPICFPLSSIMGREYFDIDS
jgi:hypothetical protein